MPPLQKRALYEFIAAIVMLLVVMPVIFFARIGPDVLLILIILMTAALVLVYWVPRYLTRPKPDQPVIMDERDIAILSNVPRYQYVGIYLTFAVWLLILSALYSDKGQVPIRFIYLMLLSLLTANAVFATAGVMIEYWRAKSPSRAETDPDSLIGAAVTGKWRVAIVIVLIVVNVIALIFGPRSQTAPTCQIKPRFTSTLTQANVGVPIQFIDTSVGDATRWEWDFGDNAYSDEQNPTHAYSNPGQYTVELWVYCNGGAAVFERKDGYITVLPSGAP